MLLTSPSACCSAGKDQIALEGTAVVLLLLLSPLLSPSETRRVHALDGDLSLTLACKPQRVRLNEGARTNATPATAVRIPTVDVTQPPARATTPADTITKTAVAKTSHLFSCIRRIVVASPVVCSCQGFAVKKQQRSWGKKTKQNGLKRGFTIRAGGTYPPHGHVFCAPGTPGCFAREPTNVNRFSARKAREPLSTRCGSN